MSEKLYCLLEEIGVMFEKHEHPAVFTCEEASKHLSHLLAPPNKNLFLRDKKGTEHFLVTVSEEKRVDLKGLSDVLGSSRLSFGSPERLKRSLDLEPGSVSILGLMNDREGKVKFFIDQDLLKATHIQSHPLVNTATLEIPVEDMRKFLNHTGHEMREIKIPQLRE